VPLGSAGFAALPGPTTTIWHTATATRTIIREINFIRLISSFLGARERKNPQARGRLQRPKCSTRLIKRCRTIRDFRYRMQADMQGIEW
jgi:hypothetical protein